MDASVGLRRLGSLRFGRVLERSRHLIGSVVDSEPGHAGASVAEPSDVRLASRRGLTIILATVLGTSLAYMSDDMLNVAIPTLARDLGIGMTDVQWVVNPYFVTMLSLLLIAGSIGDIRGHRRMFLVGLAVFTVGAVLCAVAPSVPVLVSGRAVQGVGAALILASGLALVIRSFPEGERGRAVGLYMGLAAISTAAGPVLGGLLVDTLSWRAIFAAPLLFPIVAAILASTGVPETATADRRPDIAGAAAAFIAIASASFVLIAGPVDWLRPEVALAIGIAIIGAVLFVSIERRVSDPMLPLGLFRSRTFSGGNLATLLSFMVSAGAFFFVVVHLQSTLGYRSAVAGLALMPWYLVMLVGSPLAGRLADRIGARIPVAVGLGLVAVGVWLLSSIQPGSDYPTGILPGIVVMAVGLAISAPPLTAATLGAVSSADQGVASGVNTTVGQLAGLLMIAVLPAAAGLSGSAFDDAAFAEGYRTAMLLCAALAVAAAVIAALTIPPSRQRQAASSRPSERGLE